MARPDNAGVGVPATVVAAKGINVRQAASASALKLTSWLPGVRVTVYPATTQTLGDLKWAWMSGPGGEGWAVLATTAGEQYVVLDGVTTEPPVDVPPIDEPPSTNNPALYSIALSADELQQMADLFSQMSTTALLLSQICYSVLSRIGGT